jgi:tellurite resistance protein TerC
MESIGSPMLWAGFLAVVLVMLALDLGVFQRKAHEVSLREAAIWSAVWVALSLLFNLGVYSWFGAERGMEFLTGYVIEKALSVDNIFVFVVIFGAFSVPKKYEHRVLFWGIFGALVMRAILIFAGSALLERFSWLLYLFGGFLVLTGIKLFLQKEHDNNMNESLVMRLFRRLVPTSKNYDGENFFTRENGKRLATPLLAVLVLVEATDLIFAVDSIPAIFAVTRDPFLVFTSNIFAILGLRSLYFLLAGVIDRFVYLKPALAMVLCFVGVKMLISGVYHVPIALSLGVIFSTLAGAVVLSLWKTRSTPHTAATPLPHPNTPAE